MGYPSQHVHHDPDQLAKHCFNVRRTIWITFDRVGFHCYPDAPDEVAYLRDRHRHVFKFKVEIEVFHDERDIEFHMFQSWCLAQYADSIPGRLEADGKSCETLAYELGLRIQLAHPTREFTVEVSEDGECGSRVQFGRLQHAVS